MGVDRWGWTDREGPDRVSRELSIDGFTTFHMPGASELARAPDALVRRLLGESRQITRIHSLTIRVAPDHPNQRTYPRTTIPAHLHVDPPNGSLVAPNLQIMVCRRPAEAGGDSLLFDSWKLIDELDRDAPGFVQRLFAQPRQIRLASEVVFGPTLGLRHGHLVFTHGASRRCDPIGQRLAALLEQRQLVEFRAEVDDVYINDNHRTLHGRRGFSDTRREFERVLVWLERPLQPPPARFLVRATAGAAWLARALAAESAAVRAAFGVASVDPADRPLPPPSVELERAFRCVVDAFRDAQPC